MAFKSPDHADRRKASADAKRAMIEKLQSSKKEAKPSTDETDESKK